MCAQVIPAPVTLSVYIRQWEYGGNAVNGRMLNICLRSIQSAGPESRVSLRGTVTYDAAAKSMILHSISSCFVGTSPRVS
jgi:hypothetical protein